MNVEMHGGGAGCCISCGCGEWGNCIRVRDFFGSSIIAGTNRLLHSYGDGEQVSECVALGLCGKQWSVLCQVWPMLMVGQFMMRIPSCGGHFTLNLWMQWCSNITLYCHCIAGIGIRLALGSPFVLQKVKMGWIAQFKSGVVQERWCWFKMGIWHELLSE